MTGTSSTPSGAASGPTQKGYPTIQPAVAATGRSSLDLLDLPYPFSQVGLLTASDFANLAGQRRSWAMRGLPSLDAQVLEELHRYGVLVPLFRVDLTPSGRAPVIDISASQTVKQVHTTVIAALLRAASEGRAADPAAEPFAAWPTERHQAEWPSKESGYLYSRHQLVGLDIAMSFVSEMKDQREGKSTTWHLEEDDRPNEPSRNALTSWRALAITLSALDTYYWPQVTHSLKYDFVLWRTALQEFDPAQMLAWLGLSLNQIGAQGSTLRRCASARDDTGDFYGLIRQAKAEAWDSLRGDAATAMDYRLAADLFDRYAEDLNPGTGYAGGRHTPLSQQGLSARPESLDAALTDLRLSPFPALVVGVEGETEYRLVPKVMELLDIPWGPNRIQIIDLGGTSRDLSLLARYAAEPVLGRDFGTWVALDRPLTRFLVMTDAENKYRTAADRRYQRRLLLDSLTKNVPTDLRADYYVNTERDRVVEIRTWGKLPFEFAHFKDKELAEAMLSIATVPHPRGRAQLINDLRAQRLRPAPDVSRVFWGAWSGLSKPKLAEALWPVLEAKITKSIQRGQEGPPIMRACDRAYEMATVTYGVNVALRRRRWRPRR
jgi:hypothetical protein